MLYNNEIKVRTVKLGIVNKAILAICSFKLLAPLRVFQKYLLGIELPRDVYKKKLRLGHPHLVVVNPGVVLGNNITIYQSVTTGSCQFGNRIGVPQIGDNVVIYPNSVIVGKVTIGDNSIIGAGSVVVNDVPSNAIVAGNPAKVVGHLQ